MTLFREEKDSRVTIKEEGSKATITYNGEDNIAVQATAHWKYAEGDNTILYYEMLVKSIAEGQAAEIGLAAGDFPIVEVAPGWIPDSFGYHGDDGIRMEHGKQSGEPWEQFADGNTVGLGLKVSTGEIFCTREGKFLGVITKIKETETYHPTIGLNAPGELEVNFGKDGLKFDVGSLPEYLTPLFGDWDTTDRTSEKMCLLFTEGVEDGEKLRTEVQEAAEELRKKYKFQSLCANGKEAVREFLGLKRSPLVAFIDFENQGKWALPETTPITAQNLKDFAQQIKEGKAPAIVKSAPRPPNDRHPQHPSMLQVVSSSFDELVLQGNKDVLLDVYADWCGPCKQIAPTIALLADLLQDNEHFAIAKLDCDENDVNRTYLPETSIPNIKLFRASNKTEPIKYKGTRTLDDFLEFLHTNATVKFDLEALKAKGKQLATEQEKKALKNVNAVHKTEEFREFMAQPDKLVIVDFFATWCPPCKAIAPFYADLSEEYSDVTFLKVNVDELTDVSQEEDISCMPTFKIYKNGKSVGKLEGASPNDLRALITSNRT